jgi:hypothetical protein
MNTVSRKRTWVFWGGTFTLLGSALLACAEETKRPDSLAGGPPPPIVYGSSSSDAGDAGSDAGGSKCSDLKVTSAPVDQVAFVDLLPPATGGIMTDGTYDLTEARVYRSVGGTPGPTGVSIEGALRITGRQFERVLLPKQNATQGIELRVSGTITVSGSSASVALACPNAVDEQLTYSVSNGRLTFVNPLKNELYVFSPRP